jgi:hypothetical protein
MNRGSDAYLRASWMLAETCVCPRHRMLLIEDCVHCARPFTLAGSTRSGRVILVCSCCGLRPGLDLRQGRIELAFVLEAQDRIGRLIADETTWPKLDAIIAHVWSRCGRNRTRTELDRWSGNTRLWPLLDRMMIGESHPLAFLTIRTRALVLSAVAALLGAADIGTIAPDLPAKPPRHDRIPPRPTRISRPRPARNLDDRRYRDLAESLLAHPAWVAAQALPARRRRSIEHRLLLCALDGRLNPKHDSSEGSTAQSSAEARTRSRG